MPWFDCAERRPISTNTGGSLSPNLGLVLHHAVANGSLFAFFNTPSAQVSAHFWVSKSGYIEQYVDTNVVSWHGKQLNSRYVGVETEGCVAAPHDEPMTAAMVQALARIYSEGMRRHGWANALAEKDGQPGFGYHRMAVQTACPCDVRLRERSNILAIATGSAPSTPGKPPPEVLLEMKPFGCTFETDDNVQQVFYVEDNGKMTHWYFSNRWVSEGLSNGWNPESQLEHFRTENGTHQVWGVLSNGRRCQIYWNKKNWVTQQL